MPDEHDIRGFRSERERHKRNARRYLQDAQKAIADAISQLEVAEPLGAEGRARSAAASITDAVGTLAAVNALDQVSYLADT